MKIGKLYKFSSEVTKHVDDNGISISVYLSPDPHEVGNITTKNYVLADLGKPFIILERRRSKNKISPNDAWHKILTADGVVGWYYYNSSYFVEVKKK